MKGLELCREYWETIGKPELLKADPELLSHAAIGLVGEGSECFGYDDEISKDHDWGPGFCVWLTDADMEKYGTALQNAYYNLPSEYGGFCRIQCSPYSAGRVGVMPIGDFYRRYIGKTSAPETIQEWRMTLENGLAVVTNGEIYSDQVGAFTEIRNQLLNYYPEDLRRKKLAARCSEAGQSGQYNYLRCQRRWETVAAFTALGRFVTAAQSIVFLLNRRYMPYYKWTQRALRELPILGSEIAPLIDAIAANDGSPVNNIERISGLIIEELRRQELTDATDDFLMTHAESVQQHISDERLRRMHVMTE